MIEAELLHNSSDEKHGVRSSKVAVVMPANRRTSGGSGEQIPAVSKKQETYNSDNSKKAEQTSWSFDPLTEIPTLSHQQTTKELNEVIGVKESSLNDKLKESVVEVGHKLTDAPIRDLKKAIGVNDRYVFINELFRGDEIMYERSIKTINSFRMFPEAEYWIERELKVKLGWEEKKEATRHFYQLVKRRFS